LQAADLVEQIHFERPLIFPFRLLFEGPQPEVWLMLR
jgi:hypothetical protein